jgi:hypothetical protein
MPKLSKLTDNSQLYLYNKIKHDIVLEEYLIKEFFFKNRQHLFSIVFISKFLGCWFKWQFKKKWYSSSKILQVVQTLCWWDKLSKLTDNSKFYLYNKIKHDIVLEEYLIKEKNFKNRQIIAKFHYI